MSYTSTSLYSPAHQTLPAAPEENGDSRFRSVTHREQEDGHHDRPVHRLCGKVDILHALELERRVLNRRSKNHLFPQV